VNARSIYFFAAFQVLHFKQFFDLFCEKIAVAGYGVLILAALFKQDAALETLQLLVYPFFLQLYLWRLWQLFYLFHLTGTFYDEHSMEIEQ
jgi:hypothetical protein